MKFMVMITGASGTIYGLRLIEVLNRSGYYVETIYSEESILVSDLECLNREDFKRFLSKYSKKHYKSNEIEAPPSSSSYLYDFEGFIVAPASLNTIAKAAHGITDNLINRVIANALRLRKKVVFLVRETPLGVIELKNLLILAEAGAYIVPASPGFYHNPSSIMDLVDFIVGKILDLFIIKHDLYKRWEGFSRGRDLCRSAFSDDLLVS
ncbi:MAG: UbiX family flavin prenyltransferase [Sulfolobales archaeon]